MTEGERIQAEHDLIRKWDKSYADRAREVREDHAGYYARRELERRAEADNRELLGRLKSGPSTGFLEVASSIVDRLERVEREFHLRKQAAAQSDASDYPTKRATPPRPSPSHVWCDDLDQWLFDPLADVSPALRPHVPLMVVELEGEDALDALLSDRGPGKPV